MTSIFDFINKPLPTKKQVERLIDPRSTWSYNALLHYFRHRFNGSGERCVVNDQGRNSLEELLEVKKQAAHGYRVWLFCLIVSLICFLPGLAAVIFLKMEPPVRVVVSLINGGIFGITIFAIFSRNRWKEIQNGVHLHLSQACADLMILRFCTVYDEITWETKAMDYKVVAIQDVSYLLQEIEAHIIHLEAAALIAPTIRLQYPAPIIQGFATHLGSIAVWFNVTKAFPKKQMDALRVEAEKLVKKIALTGQPVLGIR